MSIKITDVNKYTLTVARYDLENIFKQKYLVIDLESTGLNFNREEITEVGFMPLVNLKEKFKQPWKSFCKIQRKIPAHIVKLTGITDKDVAGGRDIGEMMKILDEKYHDYVWVGQCGFEFDFPFIDRMYRKYLGKKLAVQTLDTKLLYAYLFKEDKITISKDFLIKTLGVYDKDIHRHRSAGDVKVITRIFLALMKLYRKKKISKIYIDKPLVIKKFVLPEDKEF